MTSKNPYLLITNCVRIFLITIALNSCLTPLKEEPQSHSQTPVDTESMMRAADQALGNGELNKAADMLQKVLKEDPRNTTALYNLALTEDLRQNLEASSELYERLLKIDGKDALALGGLGWVRFEQYHYSESKSLSEQALAITPSLSAARLNCGLAQIALGDLEGAMKSITQAMVGDKERSLAATAIVDLKVYLDAHPDPNPIAWYPLAYCYRLKNNTENERDALQSFLDHVSDFGTYREKALKHLEELKK